MTNPYLLFQNNSEAYYLHFAKTNEDVSSVRRRILSSNLNKKRIIKYEGELRNATTELKINEYLEMKEGTNKALIFPYNANHIFIVYEIEQEIFKPNINKTHMRKSNIINYWSDQELNLLFQGTIQEVAAVTGRTILAVKQKREKIKDKNPELFVKLTTNIPETVKESLISKKRNNTIARKWYTEDEDKIIVLYEDNIKKVKELLNHRNALSIYARRANIKQNISYYNKLKESVKNLKNLSDLKQQMENRINRNDNSIIDKKEKTIEISKEVKLNNEVSEMFNLNINGISLILNKKPNNIRFIDNSLTIN